LILARSPVRITFAGGGTDIKSYYERDGGFLIAAGLNKYTWVMVNSGGKDSISPWNRMVGEALMVCGMTDPIGLRVLNDVPHGTGLGTSGSFIVAMFAALKRYQGKTLNKHDLAELACYLEIEVLGAPIGKQDQYAAAFGGINGYTFDKRGNVRVEPLVLCARAKEALKERLIIFHTGLDRKASDVLTGQVREMEQGGDVLKKLDRVKEMAVETKKLLEDGRFDDWGLLLDDYWKVRRSISTKISNDTIDDIYDTALKNGATGGKLQGAGSGGYMMFYCPGDKDSVRRALDLEELHFNWDTGGVRTWKL